MVRRRLATRSVVATDQFQRLGFGLVGRCNRSGRDMPRLNADMGALGCRRMRGKCHGKKERDEPIKHRTIRTSYR